MRQKSFKKLLTWQQAMRLIEVVYRFTAAFPADERSGLTTTLRRIASAIPAAIATAYGYNDTGKLCDTLIAAMGSLRELQSYMAIARRMGYGSFWRSYGLTRRIVKLEALFDATVIELQDRMQTRADEAAADADTAQRSATLAKAA